MLTWLRTKCEERRSNRAIIDMIDGLLVVAEDWKHTAKGDGVFSTDHTLTSEALKVTLRWTVRWMFHSGDEPTDYELVLDGAAQPIPRACWSRVDKLVRKTRAHLKNLEAIRKRTEAETKLAQWVVDNHRNIRRVELGPGAIIEVPGPGVVPMLLHSPHPRPHQWDGKWIIHYHPAPDLYELEDGSRVDGSEVRRRLRAPLV